MTNKKFNYKVHWSDEDECFVGTCANLPGLSHLDSSKEAALAGIESLVKFVVGRFMETSYAEEA